ncbi:MAG TPA: tRNA uridine-5-carboxymethylaminomethyl(34) synthesis GTPase MnmE [Ignavibacteria bacterium]
MYIQDTICAIATPIGEGGISIIRVSGKNSFDIVKKIFEGKGEIENYKPFTIHFGKIIDPEFGLIDEVLISIFKAPHSYTGEDLIEINSHGGSLVTKKIINLLLRSGARLAEPGEFTKRAFLNGRIDLTQAEGVADLIHAQSDTALKCSLKSISGEYGRTLKKYHQKLLDICSLIELELDFVEDDIQFVDNNEILNMINNLLIEINQMINSFELGKLYKDGVKVVLLGKPNVGKSTILNSLIKSNRAIVSHIPGTTRDFIEESFYFDGVLYRIFDTAGLRETNDEIEKEGINRTKEQAKDSDILVYIFDLTQEYYETDFSILKEFIDLSKKNRQELIIVFNKSDLIEVDKIDIFKNNKLNTFNLSKNISISAHNDEDILHLKEIFGEIISVKKNLFFDEKIVTNIRHRDALIRTKDSLNQAISAIVKNESNEFISVHLRKALNSLGEVIGTVSTEDILNNIFSKFCIGK